MKYRKLGKTDIEVSVVCQGCWSLISQDFNWGSNDPADSAAAIQASLDAGVNFFDTAEAYGHGESEELLGKALGPRRKEVIVASKVAGEELEPSALKKACAESLARLGTDYIDLYQIHWPNPEVPLADSIGAMEELRTEGKILQIGVSNFGIGYMKELSACVRAQANQLCYSLLMRSIEYEVQPFCAANDISVLCYSPICQGLLTGKFATPDEVPQMRARTRIFSKDRPGTRHGQPGCEVQAFEAIDEIRQISESLGESVTNVSMAWLIAQDAVASVVVGGRNAAQAQANAKAGDLDLSPDVLTALDQATRKVKEYMGSNCDPWQSESRLERP